MSTKFDELARGLAQSVTRREAFKKFGVKLARLALACAALAAATTGTRAETSLPANAAALFANVGGAFVFTPTGTPGVFNVTADGIGQASNVGNFTDHALLQVIFPPPGSPQPIVGSGTGTWTTSDGKSTVTLSLTATITPDPAGNPLIFNNAYQVTITGGTGAFASATGTATANEVVKFKPDLSGGIFSLTVKGYAVTPPSGN